MSEFALIHPLDDRAAREASKGARAIEKEFVASGHTRVADVTDLTPPDTANISAALGSSARLICYFGHGDEKHWLTSGAPTVDATHFSVAAKKAVVAVACKSGCNLGPDAVTAGVEAYLGFTSQVGLVDTNGSFPHRDAIVLGLKVLAAGLTMGEARDAVCSQLDGAVKDYDTGGKYATHSSAAIGYFVALAMRDHVVLHGNAGFQPL